VTTVVARSGLGKGQLAGFLALAAGGAFILGAFLPWAKVSAPLVGTITGSGFDMDDGWLFVALGVVCALVGIGLLSDQSRRGLRTVLILCGVAGLGLGWFEYARISDNFDSARSELAAESSYYDIDTDVLITNHGNGLYVLFGAGALALVAGSQLQTKPVEDSLAGWALRTAGGTPPHRKED
jgi:hypothetical protein